MVYKTYFEYLGGGNSSLLIFIIVSIIIGTIYVYYNMDSPAIVFNSCIIAPVSWSWIAKPILNKLGIDYKKD